MILFKFFHVLTLAIFLNSCLVHKNIQKHPCQSEDFTKDLTRLSEQELIKLANVLETSSYASATSNGCRAALLGRVYEALDRMSKASDYFSEAAKKLPDVSEYFLLAKANAEIKKQNLEQAHKIATALLDSKLGLISPQFSLRVRSVLAEIAALKRDDQQIIKTHETLLEKGYSENEVLLFNLASALTNVGDYKKANEIYKKLLVNFPLSPGAKRAEDLRTLAQYDLTLKESEKRFDKLIEQLAFDQVVDDCDRLAKNEKSDEKKDHLRAYSVKALMLKNQFDAGLERAKTNAAKGTARDQETYAWSLAKVGRFIDASENYGKFFNLAKKKEDRAKACFFRGFSLYEASLYSMAMFAWQSCHAEMKGSDLQENYLWYLALASMLNGNHQKSISILTELKNMFKKSNETQKYQYFTAYNLDKLGKREEANAIFTELTARAEPSYYSLLSERTLGLPNKDGVLLSPDALSENATKTDDDDHNNALMLYNLGFKEEAREIVLRSKTNANEKAAILQYMGFYHDVWQSSYRLDSKALVQGRALKVNNTIRAAFPLPHRHIINNISKKYSVNKNLIYAIMRAESGFREAAVSSRGARGLMQMMPFVAHELASRLSLNRFHERHLNDPKISIELGTLFVAILQRQFDNQHLVVAAYNAGPHQVQKWIDSFGHLPVELFIERIPFKQTRDYVKNVLPSESLYHALNGQNLRLAM